MVPYSRFSDVSGARRGILEKDAPRSFRFWLRHFRFSIHTLQTANTIPACLPISSLLTFLAYFLRWFPSFSDGFRSLRREKGERRKVSRDCVRCV